MIFAMFLHSTVRTCADLRCRCNGMDLFSEGEALCLLDLFVIVPSFPAFVNSPRPMILQHMAQICSP